MADNFWIVECMDEAILGLVSGVKKRETIAGPFTDYDHALEEKRKFLRAGSCFFAGATYYTIEEAEEKPANTEENYHFIDADREFDDCHNGG